MVWSLPYISSNLLRENLVCITFGKPLVSIKLAQSVAQRRPDISSTIHSIQMEGDPVPSLMNFLDVSWSAQELSESNNGSQNVMTFAANTVSLQDSCMPTPYSLTPSNPASARSFNFLHHGYNSESSVELSGMLKC